MSLNEVFVEPLKRAAIYEIHQELFLPPGRNDTSPGRPISTGDWPDEV
jgi:hypothetical protein